jgi:hypothetical protein
MGLGGGVFGVQQFASILGFSLASGCWVGWWFVVGGLGFGTSDCPVGLSVSPAFGQAAKDDGIGAGSSMLVLCGLPMGDEALLSSSCYFLLA